MDPPPPAGLQRGPIHPLPETLILFKLTSLFWLCWVFIAACGLPLVVASKRYSVAVMHGLSCPMACGIIPDQGSNPCSLHQLVDS